MSDTLFPVDDYIVDHLSTAQRRAREVYPFLEILDVQIDDFSHSFPLVLVEVAADTRVFETGHAWSSQWTEQYKHAEDNRFSWNVARSKPQPYYEGFLQCVATLDDDFRTVILHLVGHITDIDSSKGIPIDQVTAIYAYDENAADVLAAYQNAEVDGNTYNHQKFAGLPTEPVFSVSELEPYVTVYWPKPRLIYERLTQP